MIIYGIITILAHEITNRNRKLPQNSENRLTEVF